MFLIDDGTPDLFKSFLKCVSYRMYALCITLCVTVGGNAFPQPQRRLCIWYYDLVLEDFISLIDVFSDFFQEGYSQSSS